MNDQYQIFENIKNIRPDLKIRSLVKINPICYDKNGFKSILFYLDIESVNLDLIKIEMMDSWLSKWLSGKDDTVNDQLFVLIDLLTINTLILNKEQPIDIAKVLYKNKIMFIPIYMLIQL